MPNCGWNSLEFNFRQPRQSLEREEKEKFVFVSLRTSYNVHMTSHKAISRSRRAIGSLSSDVFERCTSTGSEVFSLLTCLDDIKFVFLSFFTVIEAIWLKICAKPPSKNEKRPLPVDVRRSKTLLLKLPIDDEEVYQNVWSLRRVVQLLLFEVVVAFAVVVAKISFISIDTEPSAN